MLSNAQSCPFYDIDPSLIVLENELAFAMHDGFPVTDTDFINACSEAWFGGYSRISDEKPIEKVKLIPIEVT